MAEDSAGAEEMGDRVMNIEAVWQVNNIRGNEGTMMRELFSPGRNDVITAKIMNLIGGISGEVSI